MRKFLSLLILALIAITALMLFSTRDRTDQKARLDQAEGQGTAQLGGPFTLTDQNGKETHDSDFHGRVMLVFFGFTHCPDECPATVAALTQMMKLLGPRADQVAPIFITVDPARDNPAALKDFLSNFDKRFVGLTGTPEQIKQVAELYKVYYARETPAGASFDPKNADYNVDHSSFIYMMGRDGKFLRLFSYNAAPQEMAHAIAHYLGS